MPATCAVQKQHQENETRVKAQASKTALTEVKRTVRRASVQLVSARATIASLGIKVAGPDLDVGGSDSDSGSDDDSEEAGKVGHLS